VTGLSGFWRLLIVLYALVALRVLYATRAPEWNCVERRARCGPAGSIARQYPVCSTVSEFATEAGIPLGALAVLIVGAGLVVRWVYRGFKRQP